MGTYNSDVDVNAVIWITSLTGDEYNVTRRILDDLVPYLNSQEIGFFEFEPKTGHELLVLLDVLADYAAKGLRPIIHIDTHGNTDGLGIKASGELVPWEDIVDRLRVLNTATENNLCVISLACFGFHLMTQLHIMETTPFFILAGSQEKVYVSFIEQVVVEFYKHVFDNDDIMGAIEQYLTPGLRVLHSEKLAFEVLARYVRAGTMGAPARQRVNDLITVVATTAPQGHTPNISLIRKLAKEYIKPNKAILDRMVKAFLIGREVPYDIDEVVAYAKTIPDPYADGKRRRPSPLDHV